MNDKELLLSQFIAVTRISDSGLARDLLAGSHWNLVAAVSTYSSLMGAGPTSESVTLSSAGSSPQYAGLLSSNVPALSGSCPGESLGRADMESGYGSSRVSQIPCHGKQCCKKRQCVPCAGNMSSSWAEGVHENVLNSDKERLSISSASSIPAAAANLKYKPDEHVKDDGTTEETATPMFPRDTLFTFTMPNLSKEDPDFAAFVERDLVDSTMMSNLEAAGRLNWWSPPCERLIPRTTIADGNCLLHSASLCMWGYGDEELYLRKELHRVMAETKKGDWLYRRWRWHQMQQNKQMALVYSEAEWDREWRLLLNLASPQPKYVSGKSSRSEYDGTSTNNSDATRRRSNSMGSRCRLHREVYYKSLEEFHVFVLAHILRRPVLVVADTVLRSPSGDVLQQLPFGGVYLPLGHPPAECHKAPLLIAYDSSHFSALLPESESGGSFCDGRSTPLVPLMDPEGSLLPLHFVVDPGERFDWTENLDNSTSDMTAEAIVGLLGSYLKIEYIEWSGSADSATPSALELEVGKSAKKGEGGSGKSTLYKLKKSLTLSRKAKKPAAGNALKSKSRSKDSLDELTSDGRRSSAESPADYLLCAQLLIELGPHYNDRVCNYLCEKYRTFDLRRRGAPAAAVHCGSIPDALSSRTDCGRASANAQPTTAAVCPHRCGNALTTAGCGNDAGTSPVPDVTCPRAALRPEKDAETKVSGRSFGVVGVVAVADAPGATTGCRSARKCRSNDCKMYGTAENDHYCSQCYAQAKQQQQCYKPSPPSSPTGCDPRVVAPVPCPRSASRQASLNGATDEATAAVAAMQLTEGCSQHRRLSRQSSQYDNLSSDGSAVTGLARSSDTVVVASPTPRRIDDGLARSSVDGLARGSVEGLARGSVDGLARGSVDGLARSSVDGLARTSIDGLARISVYGEAPVLSISSKSHQGRAAPEDRAGAARSLTGDASSSMQAVPRSSGDGSCAPRVSVGNNPADGQLRAASGSGTQSLSRGPVPQPEAMRSASEVTTRLHKSNAIGSHGRYQPGSLMEGNPPRDVSRGSGRGLSAERTQPSSSGMRAASNAAPSLYYTQLHEQQQRQSASSGGVGSEWCRVRGCKQPAKHDGKCLKCSQSDFSSAKFADKYRRSMRLPHRPKF